MMVSSLTNFGSVHVSARAFRIAARQSLSLFGDHCALTAGVENFLPYVPEGVVLCNAAGVHDTSTAELAVALALASGRHLDHYARNNSGSIRSLER